jgi:S-adenosylmethionine hydrolase
VQSLAVELSTSGVLDDIGAVVEWRFCWRDEKWIPSTTVDDHIFTKVLPISVTARCPETLSASFHTQDIFTVKSIPCGDTFKSGDVHTSSTGYLLKVKSNTTNDIFDNTVRDGIVIYEISVVDTVLNQSMNYFNSKEIDTIYTFWDGLTTTSYSRDATYSTSSFEVSGGSKAEYVELLGGSTNSGSTTEGSYTYRSFNMKD